VDSWRSERAIGRFLGGIFLKNDSILDFSFVLIFEKIKGAK
jgi:hypothetical protein